MTQKINSKARGDAVHSLLRCKKADERGLEGMRPVVASVQNKK